MSMPITLWDVQAGFGGVEPGKQNVVTAGTLVQEMQRVSIDKALIRMVPDNLDSDVPLSNRRLYEAMALHPELVPCPVVVPNTGYDLPSEPEQVQDAIRHGAWAVTIRPQRDCWCLEPWCCDRMFHALQERRLPVLVLERMVGADQVAKLAARYPDLPFIFTELNYRALRVYLPLIETFHNVYLSTGNNNTMQNGLELMVGKRGPDCLLFGTGFPVSEMMPAITQLMYADLSEAVKCGIGSRNLEHLVGRIVR